jgi:phage host-nuclease inhibitor protein Gam
MPKDIDSRLNDTLDITSDIKVQTGEIVREVKKLPTTTDQSESIVNDYKYTRENLYGLV